MEKYAQITDENTKAVSVGVGTNTAFYESIGMTEMDVEQGYDGQWYVAGYAPKEAPVEERFNTLRMERDARLAAMDYYVMLDYPVEDKSAVFAYRQALRDLPAQEGAPWDGGGEKTPWPAKPEL